MDSQRPLESSRGGEGGLQSRHAETDFMPDHIEVAPLVFSMTYVSKVKGAQKSQLITKRLSAEPKDCPKDAVVLMLIQTQRPSRLVAETDCVAGHIGLEL